MVAGSTPPRVGTILRALIFNLAFYGWTALLAIAFLPLLLASPRTMRRAGRFWAESILRLARWSLGLDVEIRGLDTLPQGPVIFAAKHQSAWDTIVFPARFDVPALIAKKELRLIPFYGWYAWRAGMIWVDRSGRATALRGMIRQALDRLKQGRDIVIFPQGTRTAPGAAHVYHPGVAALYAGTAAPLVPVALNSGLFWGRRAFLKRGGTITIEILPPIPRGLDREACLEALAEAIEPATRRLEQEALKQMGHDQQSPPSCG